MIKKVGYCLYAHVSNLSELMENLNNEQKLLVLLAMNRYSKIINSSYEVIKFNKKNNSVSLIESPDWNKTFEPTVGTSYCFNQDGGFRKISGGNRVYHNKWQFVSKYYQGFDIEESKERTKLWSSIPNIKEHKTRIGNKYYWYDLLKKNSISIN